MCFTDHAYVVFWPGEHLFHACFGILPWCDKVCILDFGQGVETIGYLLEILIFGTFGGFTKHIHHKWRGA
jgi:hypothetical protein